METYTEDTEDVLNLIINGLPSKHKKKVDDLKSMIVLNLIINGLPSKLQRDAVMKAIFEQGFKPYYKWITF